MKECLELNIKAKGKGPEVKEWNTVQPKNIGIEQFIAQMKVIKTHPAYPWAIYDELVPTTDELYD